MPNNLALPNQDNRRSTHHSRGPFESSIRSRSRMHESTSHSRAPLNAPPSVSSSTVNYFGPRRISLPHIIEMRRLEQQRRREFRERGIQNIETFRKMKKKKRLIFKETKNGFLLPLVMVFFCAILSQQIVFPVQTDNFPRFEALKNSNNQLLPASINTKNITESDKKVIFDIYKAKCATPFKIWYLAYLVSFVIKLIVSFYTYQHLR